MQCEKVLMISDGLIAVPIKSACFASYLKAKIGQPLLREIMFKNWQFTRRMWQL